VTWISAMLGRAGINPAHTKGKNTPCHSEQFFDNFYRPNRRLFFLLQSSGAAQGIVEEDPDVDNGCSGGGKTI
jgi:hypothetical protein